MAEIGAAAHFDIMKHQRTTPPIAQICEHCAWRETIIPLLGMPFCEHSSSTCSLKANKKHCEDFKERAIQLELFA